MCMMTIAMTSHMTNENILLTRLSVNNSSYFVHNKIILHDALLNGTEAEL